MNENETITVLLHEITFIDFKINIAIIFQKPFCVNNSNPSHDNFHSAQYKTQGKFQDYQTLQLSFPFFFFHRCPFKLAKCFVGDCLQSHLKPDCLKPTWEDEKTNIKPSTFHQIKLYHNLNSCFINRLGLKPQCETGGHHFF
jgi:hypothetical protein